VPPEIQAYALAEYSRSDQALQTSIDELTAQRAEQFLATFYFQYGHRSIADLAHITLAVEHVSLLAAFYVSDEPLWDGQSRSSRYQDFRKNGFYTPPAVAADPALLARYQAALDDLLSRYEYFLAEFVAILRQVVPQPAEMSPATYTRTLRARALDVARYFLPLATLTSLGQITNARSLELQISRLTAQPLPELHAIGDAMRAACRTPGKNFVARKLEDAIAAADLTPEQAALLRDSLTANAVLNEAAAPTLVKYTAPDAFGPSVRRHAHALLAPHLATLGEPDRAAPVALIPPETDPLDAYITALLYVVDPAGHAYQQLAGVTATLPQAEKTAILRATLADRGPHDDWQRAQRVGYTIGFDMLLDFGALRDLNRHRRCVQLLPDLKTTLGHDDAAQVIASGLSDQGAEIAAAKGLIVRFGEALDQALETAQTFPDPLYATYLLPLGARQRFVMKMDVAEAAYIIELRSKLGGHFAYRQAAFAMYEQLTARYPYLAEVITVTPPTVVDLLQR
jgi:thymidylate synthase ThyX